MTKTPARENQASVTHHRDLRTGQSIWSARRRPHVPTQPLTRDISCDVVIIGAGDFGGADCRIFVGSGLKGRGRRSPRPARWIDRGLDRDAAV